VICNLVGHKASVTCLEYHNYADYIASGSIDSQIRVSGLYDKTVPLQIIVKIISCIRPSYGICVAKDAYSHIKVTQTELIR
jgi:WD40 repeat protein